MKLLKLTVGNWMNHRQFCFEPNGADASLYALNGGGKSNLLSAYSWLLYGKDMLGAADFGIKTLGPDMLPLHNLDHWAEAQLETPDGVMTLKKVYHEKWERKRANASATFSGHETDCFVNGVPVLKNEYEARVARLGPPGLLQDLTDPVHFLQRRDWKYRRQALLDMCGDISDKDVIQANPALKELPGILGSLTMDELRKKLKASRTELNQELDRVPVRIDEAERSRREIPSGDWPAAVERLGLRIKEAQAKRAELGSGGDVAEQVKKLREIEGALIDRKNQLRSQGNPERDKALAERALLTESIGLLEALLGQVDRRTLDGEQEVARLTRKRESLVQEFETERGKGFAGEDACPACGQALPAERVEAAKSEFNSRKASALEAIQTQGKGVRTLLDAAEAALAGYRSEREKAVAELEPLRLELDGLTVPAAVEAGTATDATCQELEAQKAAAELAVSQAREGGSAEVGRLDREIAELAQDQDEARGHVAAATLNKQADERKAQLGEEQKKAAAAFELTEKQLFLCDEFVRAKVRLLTDRINGRFQLCRWILFKELVNGAVEEICECYCADSGAPPSHGQAIRCGLECIDVIGRHHGLTPPIVVDNAESLTSFPRTAAQQVRLIASAGDKTLRVELAGPTPSLQVVTPDSTAADEPQEALAF